MRKRKDETMKRMKRVLAFALAAVMTAAMSLSAFAEDVEYTGSDKANGSIKITNTTIGQKYEVYKLFDASVASPYDEANKKGISYTLPAGKTIEAPADDWFEVTAVGNVIAKDALEDAVKAAAQNPDSAESDPFITWAKTFGTKVNEHEATENSINFTKLPYGYYFVVSQLGAVISVDSTTPNVELIDKNQIPTPDNGDDNPGKVIIDENGNKATVSNASLKEGKTFDIAVNATNYYGEKKIWKYVITDELGDGMTYDMTDLTVKVGDTELAEGDTNGYVITYKKADDTATQDPAEAQSFRVEINWTDGGTLAAAHLYDNAVEIHVTYKAFLDPAKAEDVQSGSTPNKNKANFFFYSDDDDPDGKDPDPLYPDFETETYTTDVEISKVDDEGNPLEGAQFTLTSTDGAKVIITITDSFEKSDQGTYWKLKDGSYTATDPNGEGINQDLYENIEEKYIKTQNTLVAKGEDQTETSMSAFVDSTGKVVFRGLGEGTYKIEETVVPSGFNKAADVEFTVSFDADTKKFSVESESEITVDENKLKVTIQNNKGVELPSTGGVGTTMFYIIGSILVIGAGIVLVAKRRMNLR